MSEENSTLKLTLTDGCNIVNDTEKYGKPTIWEDQVSDKVTGGTFTTNGKVVTGQVQYYIEAKNAEDPNARIANVKDLSEFKAALEDENKTVINLTADFSTNEKILIDRAVTINGNNHTITFANDAEGWQGNYVLHVYKATGVTIKNIKLTGGDAALYVNGSEVTLEGTVDITGNKFGGIEVSQGKDVTNVPKLTVTGAITYQSPDSDIKPVIWIDGRQTNDGWVVAEGLYEEVAGKNPANNGDQYYFFDKDEYRKAVLERVNIICDRNNYREIRIMLEENAFVLGLDIDSSPYSKLVDARKEVVARDIIENRPDNGYTLEQLQFAFTEISATRLVFEQSLEFFIEKWNYGNNGTLADINYIDMLISNLEKVEHHDSHSGRSIKDDVLPELRGLKASFGVLTEKQQSMVLNKINERTSLGGSPSSSKTRRVLVDALADVIIEQLNQEQIENVKHLLNSGNKLLEIENTGLMTEALKTKLETLKGKIDNYNYKDKEGQVEPVEDSEILNNSLKDEQSLEVEPETKVIEEE